MQSSSENTDSDHQVTSQRLKIGFIFAIASAAMFAVRPIFVKLVYQEGTDATTLIALRMLFSLPIYMVLLGYFLHQPELRQRLNLKNISQISVIGLFGYYFASFFDLLGLQYVSAQLGRMILYTYPTMVVLLGAAFFKEKISIRVIYSLILSYVGISFIFGHDFQLFGQDVITGALLISASAFSFALYLLFGKPLIEEVGPRLFTCLALISASIGILLHFGLTHGITPVGLNQRAVFWVLIIAIFCTVIPTFFTTAAVARIGANRTGIVAMLGPAFTSAAAVSILGESFTYFHAAGILMIVGGVWILRRL